MSETNEKDLAKVRNMWKPNPKQAEFLSIPHTIKEAFYGGGAGSGKSDLLLMFGILNRWHEVSVWKQVFMRRTYPELKNEILGRSREIYSKFGATFNKTDMIWTFPRTDQYGAGMMTNAGAQIFLGHCEHEDDVHQYDSMQICLYTPDEITSYTQNIYNYITFERNRSPQGYNLPSITRCAGMPGGVGHAWVKKRFVDPYKKGGKIIQGKGGNKRIFIHATFVDNQDHIDPTYGKSLDGRPEAERKAKKFGDFDAYLGQVFEEFRDKKYSDEPEHAIHVIPPMELPAYWPRFVIIDWGFRANNWVGFFAVSPQRRLYLYRELTWTKTKITEWGPIVRSFIDMESPKIVKLCKSAGQDRGQENTIQTEIEKELGPVTLTTNSAGSRVSGKTLLHEYFRWTPKPKVNKKDLLPFNYEKSLEIMRRQGNNAYISYLEQYDEPTEELLPKYQIFCCDKQDHSNCTNCCPGAIDAIKSCNYSQNTKGDKPAEDVAEFSGDDAYDGQRYAVDTAEQYFQESADEFEKFRKQQALEEKLRKTGDWTGFYRTVEHSEQQNAVPMKMVRVFGRSGR